MQECGIEEKSGRALVRVDPRYYRPTEVEQLIGDASKARKKLGWTHRTNFEELVAEMVESDLRSCREKNPGATIAPRSETGLVEILKRARAENYRDDIA